MSTLGRPIVGHDFKARHEDTGILRVEIRGFLHWSSGFGIFSETRGMFRSSCARPGRNSGINKAEQECLISVPHLPILLTSSFDIRPAGRTTLRENTT